MGTAARELLNSSVEILAPIVINKFKANQPPVIYRTDYQTPHGTCIRDFEDVRDIAGAHLSAAVSTSELLFAMNVRTSHRGSVREVIKLMCESACRNYLSVVEVVRSTSVPAFYAQMSFNQDYN